MTPTKANKRVVAHRIEWINRMISEIQELPLEDFKEFKGDKRNIWAAESCMRRALEALFDLGRHLLAKCFGKGVSEYKSIAIELGQRNVLDEDETLLLRTLAGYRNRLVHFYSEVTTEELFKICATELTDLKKIQDSFVEWFKENPDYISEDL